MNSWNGFRKSMPITYLENLMQNVVRLSLIHIDAADDLTRYEFGGTLLVRKQIKSKRPRLKRASNVVINSLKKKEKSR